jgi:hypothetical protein
MQKGFLQVYLVKFLILMLLVSTIVVISSCAGNNLTSRSPRLSADTKWKYNRIIDKPIAANGGANSKVSLEDLNQGLVKLELPRQSLTKDTMILSR